MKIIKPSFKIESPFNGQAVLEHLERTGRTCYKSEHKIADDTALTFIRTLIKSGHESVIEHYLVTVRIICDRGISHELVRHRLASFSQESTRYCNYSKGKFGNEITVIRPFFWKDDSQQYRVWKRAMKAAEEAYFALLKMSAKAQEARSVLPNSLKTEIVMTANLREWRTIFKQRCVKAAHPQMWEIMIPILHAFQTRVPVIFDDIRK